MRTAVALLICAFAASAQTMDEKAWIAAKIYSSIRMYFAHLEGAPDLDLDREFQEYLKEATAAMDRRGFSLATMKLFGKLRNGHSGFYDQSLRTSKLSPPGFFLRSMEEGWVVVASAVDGMDPGDVIAAINGEPVDTFYAKLDPFLEGSSEAARRRRAPYADFLWPEKMDLTLANGKRVSIDRTQPPRPVRFRGFPGAKLEPPTGVAYRRIASFDDAAKEPEHVEFVRQHSRDRAIVFDVRGNGGGRTPLKLLNALMDRAWREMSYTTPMHIAHAGAQGQVGRAFSDAVARDDYLRGYVEAFQEMEKAQILTPGALHAAGQSAYKGKVIVVTDGDCNSACEDFVAPLKTSGRAVIVGEATNGSTGQPYYYDFGNGMSFRLSTKRYYLADGTAFEGRGIQPDVALRSALADLVAGRDPVLARAFALAVQ